MHSCVCVLCCSVCVCVLCANEYVCFRVSECVPVPICMYMYSACMYVCIIKFTCMHTSNFWLIDASSCMDSRRAVKKQQSPLNSPFWYQEPRSVRMNDLKSLANN